MINYPFPVHYLEIGSNLKMAYCDEGQGEQTILFVHGLANYLPVFKHNIEELKKDFRCIAVDLPGNGLSSRGDYPFSMFFYAESLARFINELKLEKVVLAGHSMGGQISIILSLRYPQLVDKLVLLAPSGLEYFSDLERTLVKSFMQMGSFIYGDAMSLESAINNSYYHEKKKDAKHIISDLLKLMQGKEGKYWGKMVQANIEAMLDEQVQPFLKQISQETLILFGKQDALIPNKLIHVTETIERLVKKSEELIPNCKSEIFSHCGHFIQIEAAPKVNEAMKRFLLPKEN
jgi:pimeloyl-ACP methyl ester carboxylesterase